MVTDRTCLNGHPLKPYLTPVEGFHCESCGQANIAAQQPMMGCHHADSESGMRCDFDVCSSCIPEIVVPPVQTCTADLPDMGYHAQVSGQEDTCLAGDFDLFSGDLLVSVFSRLPIRDVVRLSSVCRRFYHVFVGDALWKEMMPALDAKWNEFGGMWTVFQIHTEAREGNMKFMRAFTSKEHAACTLAKKSIDYHAENDWNQDERRHGNDDADDRECDREKYVENPYVCECGGEPKHGEGSRISSYDCTYNKDWLCDTAIAESVTVGLAHQGGDPIASGDTDDRRARDQFLQPLLHVAAVLHNYKSDSTPSIRVRGVFRTRREMRARLAMPRAESLAFWQRIHSTQNFGYCMLDCVLEEAFMVDAPYAMDIFYRTPVQARVNDLENSLRGNDDGHIVESDGDGGVEWFKVSELCVGSAELSWDE